MDGEDHLRIHDLLDELVLGRGFFRGPLLASGLSLGETPFFTLAVHQDRAGILWLHFSVDDAFNAVAPEREVREVAEVCVQAVRDAFPATAGLRIEPRFAHGGTPPRPMPGKSQ